MDRNGWNRVPPWPLVLGHPHRDTRQHTRIASCSRIEQRQHVRSQFPPDGSLAVSCLSQPFGNPLGGNGMGMQAWHGMDGHMFTATGVWISVGQCHSNSARAPCRAVVPCRGAVVPLLGDAFASEGFSVSAVHLLMSFAAHSLSFRFRAHTLSLLSCVSWVCRLSVPCLTLLNCPSSAHEARRGHAIADS
jgi:hypothetical protein